MPKASALGFASRGEWREWLASNHGSSGGAWLLIHKKGSSRRGLRYEEAVEEALCFGWIDSRVRAHDADRFVQWFSPRKEGSVFRRGDVNGSGALDISDAVYLLFWQFVGAGDPGCLEAADADGNGVHDITDVTFLLMYLFLGGELPPAPGPGECGLDPVPTFGCASYTAC